MYTKDTGKTKIGAVHIIMNNSFITVAKLISFFKHFANLFLSFDPDYYFGYNFLDYNNLIVNIIIQITRL